MWHLMPFYLCFDMCLMVQFYLGVLLTNYSLEVCAIHRYMIPCWSDFHACTVWVEMTIACCFWLFAFGSKLGAYPVVFIGYSLRSVVKYALPLKNFKIDYVISGLLFYIYISSTISLWSSFVYLRESPIWKCEVVILDCVESLQCFFVGFTWNI